MSKKFEPRNVFNLAQIERGLLELAMANGSPEAAVRVLEADDEAGFSVSAQTLSRWRARDVDHYESIRAGAREKLFAISSEHHLRVSEQAARVVSKLVDRVDQTMDELPARDIPAAARNMSVVSGVHADKAREASGGPAPIKLRDVTEVLRDLADLGYKPQLIDDQRSVIPAEAIVVDGKALADTVPPRS